MHSRAATDHRERAWRAAGAPLGGGLGLLALLVTCAGCSTAGEEPRSLSSALNERDAARGVSSDAPIVEMPPPPGLLSDAPLPPPVALPQAPLAPAVDVRARYVARLADGDVVRLVVRVRELIGRTFGQVARGDVVMSDGGTTTRTDFLLPAGTVCEDGAVHVGDVILLHVSRRDLEGTAPVVMARAVGGLTRVSRAAPDGASFRVDFPWGPESFELTRRSGE